MKKIWIVLITVIVTGGLVGGGTYYLTNKKATKDKDSLQAQINDLNTKVADAEKTLADAAADTEDNLSNSKAENAETTKASPVISLDQLKNITLSQGIKLTDGTYYDTTAATKFKADKDQYKTFLVDDNIARGNLDSDSYEDVAALTVEVSGGTGYFYSLNAIKNNNGSPQYLSSVSIGDGLRIDKLEINNKTISLTYAEWNSGDYGPTKTVSYRLVDNKLVKQ